MLAVRCLRQRLSLFCYRLVLLLLLHLLLVWILEHCKVLCPAAVKRKKICHELIDCNAKINKESCFQFGNLKKLSTCLEKKSPGADSSSEMQTDYMLWLIEIYIASFFSFFQTIAIEVARYCLQRLLFSPAGCVVLPFLFLMLLEGHFTLNTFYKFMIWRRKK